MENTALAVDPFEAAMANLATAGIDFEIVEEHGRDAALAEIRRRTVKTRRGHRPPDTDHGSEVGVAEGF